MIRMFITLLVITCTGVLHAAGQVNANEFNPEVSLILDGRYTDIDEGELSLPGFQLGGEAGLPANGFSMGHNELQISANIDDKFFGLMAAPIIYANGETTVELEEAYLETLALGAGFTIKAGRFFSGLGYLNAVHQHAFDFADAPLVYDALYGRKLVEDGIQLRWVAPTAMFLQFGVEANTGSAYPSGSTEDNENNKGEVAFAKIGSDIGASSSWQLGVSHYQAEFATREAGAHSHGGDDHDEHTADNELLDGEVDISGVDFVYKWAPNGNSKQTLFKFQAEYFVRNEKATSEFTENADSATAELDGEQSGFYAQAVYQFMPKWRVGVRYDQLTADNKITDFVDNGIDEDEYLEESSLGAEKDPTRSSIMVDYSPSHFSRIRLQYSTLDQGHEDGETIDALTLQYVVSLGSHGAHQF